MTTQLPATFKIPDLVSYWPFKYRVNPHHDKVSPQSNEWFDQYGVYNNNAAKRAFFFKSNFTLMTSMCYPDADEERLRNAMDFLNWLFSFDDSFDEELRGNPDATKIASEIVLGILKNPVGYETTYRLGKSLQDFWQRTISSAPPGMQARFVKSTEIYLRACHQQNVNFAQGYMPTVPEFILLRRDTSAAKPVLDFLEYTLNLDQLPDEFHEHPHIKKIKYGVNDILSWANDIDSFNIEQSRGDRDNLVIVAMHDRGYTLQEAIDFVGDMVKSRMDEFLADSKALPSFGHAADAQAEAYMHGMEVWVAGSINWNLMTERYFLTKHAEVRRTLCVEVMKPGEGLVQGGLGEGLASVTASA